MTYDYKFKLFIPALLKNEGGFVDDPDDAGGATKYGVSTRFLVGRKIDVDHDGDIDRDDIVNMTLEDAMEIYFKFFWYPYNYSLIKTDKISFRLFDFSVNAGATRCAIVLTETLLNVGLSWLGNSIAIPQNVVNDINAYPEQTYFYEQLKIELRDFYVGIARKRNNRKYLRGWLKNRVEHNPFE